MRGLAVAVLLLGLHPVLVSCAGTEQTAESPQRYTENAKRAYEEALEEYFDADWEAAIPMFEEVARKYAYSRYARLAQLRIADAHFKQEKFPEAIGGYKAFVRDYPNDAEVPYARYRVAKAHFEQSRPALLLPPLEERDLANVEEAYKTIRSFLQDYPGHQRRQELEFMLESVTGLLVRHELYVARFYLQRDKFNAAIFRIQHALRSYDGSGLEAEAMVLLGETYLRMGEPAKARQVLNQMLAEHPDSPFVVPARNFLARLGADPKRSVDVAME